MSYFSDLLIETYKLLKQASRDCKNASELAIQSRNEDDPLEAKLRANSSSEIDALTAIRLESQADAIKKRMKSLGYHDCWEVDDDMEVELP